VSTLTEAIYWIIAQAPDDDDDDDDDDECGAVSGMLPRGNQSILRKPASVPLCPPQIPHDLTRDRTQTAAVGNRRLKYETT
jgi:hypothetical protein